MAVTPVSNARPLRLTLISVALTAAVLSSLGIPLLPTIAESTGVSLSVTQWLLTATLLTGGLATPIMGRLADGPHQRRTVIFALVVVFIGSILSAAANDFAYLLVGRTLQGLGLGLLPVTMAIARRHLPPNERARTIARLSITSVAGIGLGYPATAVIAEFWSYHACFWVGAGLVGIALVAAIINLPASPGIESHRFDLPGAVLISGAMTSLIVVLSEADRWGWLSLPTIGLFVATIVLTALWARQELRTADPLVDLRQIRNRMVLTADASGLLLSLGMFLFLPLVVEFVQLPESTGYGMGASVFVGGCIFIPFSIGSVLASRLAPSFERRFGRRLMIPLGSCLFAAGMIGFVFEHAHLWETFFVTGLGGIGMGFTFAAIPGFVVGAVPPQETGSAMSFYHVLRSVGFAAGSALSSVILGAFTDDQAGALPRITAFQVCLLIGAGFCVIAAFMSYVLAGRQTRPTRFPSDHLETELVFDAGTPIATDVPAR